MSGAKTSGPGRSAEVYAHKLFAPAGHADAIPRNAILERVFAHSNARIVVLQGPAGHGKSTTMQQIKSACEARGELTAWLTLDEADNDTRRFFIHIQALIAQLSGDADADADRDQEEVSGSRRRRRSDWLLESLHRIGRPVRLFLDEFQTLTDSNLIRFCRELFERLPQNVCVFIGSRSVPRIGLARLLVQNQALLVRADDLRFSPPEVECFFSRTQGLDISHEEIGAIYRRTEGWPAALQLFRLSLASPSVRRSLDDVGSYRPRELAEYLTDSVLGLQPQQVRDFLLRTSLLTRLTAPLCDVVMDWLESQEMLLQLERSGLFVRSLDSDLRWFRYHGLFSSFLSEQLQAASKDTFNEVHQRAADWYLARGYYEETVHHSVECGNFTLAADTLNLWASQLVREGFLTTLERWYDHLPFEEIARRPDLAIKVAYALVFMRRRKKLAPLLKLLESRDNDDGNVVRTTDPDIVLSMAAICADELSHAFEIVDHVPVQGQQPEGFAAFELGAGANLIAYRHITFGDFERAHEYIALARAYNQRGDASFSGGYTSGINGMSLLAQGKLDEALTHFRHDLGERSMQLDKSFASAALVSCYVWSLYEANQLEMVESLFQQNHDAVFDAVLLDFLAVAALAMLRTHDARGRAAKALEILDEMENVARVNGWHRLVRIVTWERVRRSLLAGTTDRANSIAAGLTAYVEPLPEGWVPFSEDVEGEAFGRIRLALHNLNLDAAASMLAIEFGRNDERHYRRIRLHLLDALLQQRRGVHNAAHRSLQKALQLGQPGGFVRCFLDEGDEVLRLLREEYQAILDRGCGDDDTDSRRTFIELLLQASGTDLSRTPVTVDLRQVEPLTERENGILVYLANGVSNKEIARRIFVSENTVKFHLKNIYSKLAVNSRLQAIATARQMGLIH